MTRNKKQKILKVLWNVLYKNNICPSFNLSIVLLVVRKNQVSLKVKKQGIIAQTRDHNSIRYYSANR